MSGKLLIILAMLITTFTVCWAHNRHPNRNQYRGFNVHRDIQRDEPRTSRNGEHLLVNDEEEERYVPVSFNFDYDPSNGNGLYHGHAIEMMAPVEVPEYDWRDDASRGIISELDQGRPESVESSQELLSRSRSSPAIERCGDREIDPRHAVCCDGLVFRKTADQQDAGKCCGRVAYDDRYFTCCQGRAIVRRLNGRLPLCCGDYNARGDALPDQCRPGYQNDTTGLGSTCCRSGSGAWKCCVKGQGCCAEERGTAVIDVPGFRPACCHLANEDLTSRCCAATYEKVRVLPDCCSGERLKPVCCRKRQSTDVRCCPGTVGYCCGLDEGAVRTTGYPPRLIHETRQTIHHHPVTFSPRPSHTERLIHYPGPIYPTALPYLYRSTQRITPPRPTQPLYYPRYTTVRGPLGHSTVRYPPGQGLGASPACCQGRNQQRSCCLRTRSPTCCSSSLPRCCFTVYFNFTCCGSFVQQQQQQQQQQQHGMGNPQVHGRVGADREADVRPLSESELQRQTNGHGQNDVQPPSNGHNPRQRHGGGVTLSCCRLETRDATACCRNGYQESGRLPLCCISSPGDTVEDIGDTVQNDAAAGNNRPYQHLNGTTQRTPRHHGMFTCNGVPYNAEESLCCNGVLSRRVGFFSPACCGGAAYDSYLYKCCDGKVRTSCGSGSRPKRRPV